MFCEKCGKEISPNAKKCQACGTPVAEEVHSKSSGIKILVTIIVILAVLCVILGIVIVGSLEKTKESMAEQEMVTQEETDSEDNQEEAAELLETEVEEEPEIPTADADYTLLVCVPAEFMSLRTSPGLGDDVIAELTAGTYLKWYGEQSTVDEKDFYKVKLFNSEQEGYVAEQFCVEVECFTDEQDTTIVKFDDALYTYDIMIEDIVELCETYPDRLQYSEIGTSLDGRTIYEVILGNQAAPNHVMLQAGIHGREYLTPLLVMRLLEYYAAYYDVAKYENITYRELFENTAFHVVPMSNPDGITISQLGVEALSDSYYADLVYQCYERDKANFVYEEDTNGDMNWVDYYRQPDYDRGDNTREITFEEYQTIWKSNAAGVDINNNFNADWDNIDLKTEPAYGSFKGYAPVSEPETLALEQLALEREYMCFASYHSRGQLIYFDVQGNSAENSVASETLANLLEENIKYTPVNTQKGYNVNLGGFGDWVQLYLNKPSVTIESGKKPCPVGIEEFPGMWYRHKESWAMLGYNLF